MLLGKPLRLDQLADPRPEAQRLVLQGAFAALVAYGAVQWMIEQDEGEICFLHSAHLLGVGAHDHALAHRHRAGGHHRRAARAVHLDQAHTAAADRVQFGMRTEDGNLDARHARGIYQERPRRNRHFLLVDSELYIFNHNCDSRCELCSGGLLAQSGQFGCHRLQPLFSFPTGGRF